jgi:uncharacterized protein (TIGR03083 family)
VDKSQDSDRQNGAADIFAEIAAERRGLADLLAGLTAEQRGSASLCSEWTVQEVVGHLVVPLQVGIAKFALTMLVCGGNVDRVNTRLAREQAARPYPELVETLRQRADSRFTPPGAGPEAPLTDLLVHGLDVCWPLGLTHPVPADRWRTVLTYLATGPRSFVAPGLLDGLRLDAADVDWVHSEGATVRGDAGTLTLALTGRSVALDRLSGDGVPTLRARVAAASS